jgi:hypothetical protein
VSHVHFHSHDAEPQHAHRHVDGDRATAHAHSTMLSRPPALNARPPYDPYLPWRSGPGTDIAGHGKMASRRKPIEQEGK